ncbi:MAG: hypothetical protein ACRCV9_03585 [Burkholderiaceae bacterium]
MIVDTSFRYDPARLLDHLKRHFGVRRDNELAAALGTDRAVISRLRTGRAVFGPALLLRAHELTGIPTKELRAILGDSGAFGAIK